MGTKYFMENPRRISQNQGWNQVLPQVKNPIKQTVSIETSYPVWIDRHTRKVTKFEKVSLLQKSAHHHVTWKPSYNHPSHDYQVQNGIASLHPVIGTVDTSVDPCINLKVTSHRAVPFYSAFGYMPVNGNTLSCQIGVVSPGNGLETVNENYLMCSVHGRRKVPLRNSAYSVYTPLHDTHPTVNSLHPIPRLGDFLYLKKPHMKIYNLDIRLQRIEYDRTCPRMSCHDSLHETESLLQKGVHTWSIPLATKKHVPRSRIQYEWRYNPDRWVTVSAMCYAIEQMCRINRAGEANQPQAETLFFSTEVPDIPISDYLRRIAWFYDSPKECFVLALEYIHRVTKYNPEVVVNHNTAHRLVATCIMVATKFIDDLVFNHTFYAKVVGLPALTMSTLEQELLFMISFDLFVKPGQFKRRYKGMLHDNTGLNKVPIRPEGETYN